MVTSIIASEFSPVRLEAHQIEETALELRKRGLSYSKIAKEMGLADGSGAYKVIKRAVGRIDQETAEEARKLMVEQLNDQSERIHEILTMKDPELRLKAEGMLLKSQESLRKLLGLDAPTQITGPDGGAIEVRIGAIVEKIRELKASEPDAVV